MPTLFSATPSAGTFDAFELRLLAKSVGAFSAVVEIISFNRVTSGFEIVREWHENGVRSCFLHSWPVVWLSALYLPSHLNHLFLMARPLRIEYAGALYHVTSRGDRREDIYEDDEDREVFLEVLSHCVERFNWLVHAYCLMSNHYHLLIETPDANLSAGMRQLNGVYTQRYNRRHGEVGHLFQGRFKSILVDRDSYLLEVARYIVLNPVRAKMVNDTVDWAWSSYAATAGIEPHPEWLCTDWLLGVFSNSRKNAHATYRDFVRAGVGLPPIHKQVVGQMYLGDENFINAAKKHIPTDGNLKEVVRKQRAGSAKPISWYAEHHKDRSGAIVSAYRSGGFSMREIGDYFGLHNSTISRIISVPNAENKT